MKKTLVSVSKKALIARINRRLAKDDEMLRTLRGERDRHNLGDHYVVDVTRNLVVRKYVDLVDLGREIGALRGWERLVD